MLLDKFEKLTLKKFKIKDIVPNATVLLLGRRRSGKCLGKGTNILMYDGTIKKVEDIVIGDSVMGDDSSSRIVLGINNGIDKLYKVLNERNEFYIVNSEHILSLKYIKANIRDRIDINSYEISWFKEKLYNKIFSYKNKDKSIIYNIANKCLDDNRIIDISVKDYIKLSKKLQDNLQGYQVPILFKEKPLNIDPYIIGYFISRTFHLPLCENFNESFLRLNIDDIKDVNYKNLMIKKYDNLSSSNIKELINKLNNNQIPYNYKCNSVENRLQLLAGILDGSENTSFKNPKDKIINDIIYLSKSLGFACNIKTKGDGVCISLAGKGINKIPSIISKHLHSCEDVLITSIKIEELLHGEYYGFELDGNHRFVLGNFIVSHNSFLTRDIFFHHRTIPKGIIFSGTENANPFYGDFIPDTFIHSEYNPELIETVLVNQGKKIRESRKQGLGDSGCLPENRFFIVLDDMLADANAWKKERTIQEIFFNGRHFNIFFILTMQYPLGIPPALRSNIDYVFVFNEPSIKNRKKIYDDYGGVIPTFDHFQNILDSCTQNFECLVIKTSGNSSDIKDQVFWYKALPHDNFRAGHPKIWQFHDLKYNSQFNYERDKDKEAIDKLRHKYARSKKLKVIVNRQGEVVDDYLTEESD